LTLGSNVKPLSVEMEAATRKDIEEHILRLAKVIPASLFLFSYSSRSSVYINFGGI
jgi:hypothetical protein